MALVSASPSRAMTPSPAARATGASNWLAPLTRHESVDKPNQNRRTIARGLLAGSAFALAACSRKKNPGNDFPELDPVEAEKLYGKAPEQGGSIAYQPAVKIVGDGVKSIRAFNADGVSWMLDAGARDVENLRK